MTLLDRIEEPFDRVAGAVNGSVTSPLMKTLPPGPFATPAPRRRLLTSAKVPARVVPYQDTAESSRRAPPTGRAHVVIDPSRTGATLSRRLREAGARGGTICAIDARSRFCWSSCLVELASTHRLRGDINE